MWTTSGLLGDFIFWVKSPLTNALLEGDTGRGHDDWPELQPTSGLETEERYSCRQIGISLANPGTGVAQSNGTVQHRIQHQVAERHLLGSLRHISGKEKLMKNAVDHIMGVFPVIIGLHPKKSP